MTIQQRPPKSRAIQYQVTKCPDAATLETFGTLDTTPRVTFRTVKEIQDLFNRKYWFVHLDVLQVPYLQHLGYTPAHIRLTCHSRRESLIFRDIRNLFPRFVVREEWSALYLNTIPDPAEVPQLADVVNVPAL